MTTTTTPRSPRYPRPVTPRRSVRVRDELWNAAQDKAHDRSETVTDVVIRALERYVRE